MARDAADLALFLEATCGQDDRAPLSWTPPDAAYVDGLRGASVAGRRFAYAADPTRIGIDPELEAVCREAAFALRDAGAEVEEISLDIEWARRTFRELRGLWALAWHQHRLPEDERPGEPMGTNLRANLELGLSLSSRELGAASQARAGLLRQFLELFSRFDAVLTPTMAVKPFPSVDGHPTRIAGQAMQTYIDWVAPTSVLGLASLPVLSVPAGLDGDGLPVGLQVVARPKDELGALAIGQAVQALRPVALPFDGR